MSQLISDENQKPQAMAFADPQKSDASTESPTSRDNKEEAQVFNEQTNYVSKSKIITVEYHTTLFNTLGYWSS